MITPEDMPIEEKLVEIKPDPVDVIKPEPVEVPIAIKRRVDLQTPVTEHLVYGDITTTSVEIRDIVIRSDTIGVGWNGTSEVAMTLKDFTPEELKQHENYVLMIAGKIARSL
jgi:hypothetical protein